MRESVWFFNFKNILQKWIILYKNVWRVEKFMLKLCHKGGNMSCKELKYSKLLPNDYLFKKRVKEMGITPKYMAFYYLIEKNDKLWYNNIKYRMDDYLWLLSIN